MNKTTIKKTVITVLLFLISSMFMHAFYKSLSGFIANNFNDGSLMVTMLITFILPVICFLFYFYNYYVKIINKTVSIIYSCLVIILSVVSLVLIFSNINIYVSNNRLGVYDSIWTIILKFPFDGIISSLVLLLVQIYNLLVVFKPNHKLSYLKEEHYSLGYFNINLIEYFVLCILAILSLFTVGNFICGLNSLANIKYDPKYLFLLLWVLIIPTINLLSFVYKLGNRDLTRKNKIIYLSTLILINVLFGVILLIFEGVHPNFVVGVGKPLFPITFSISFPVEIIILLAIQGVSIIVDSVKFVLVCFRKEA